MHKVRRGTILLALTGLGTSQIAHAENAIYQGECNRAYDVKATNTVDQILQYSRYKGVSLQRLADQANSTCKVDLTVVSSLTLVSRDAAQATYNMLRKYVRIGSQNESCDELKPWNGGISGTVKFTTQLAELGSTCEVYVRAEWALKDATSTWTSNFSTRMLMLNDGSMVMSQPGPTTTTYDTPIAFTGVK